MSAYTDNSTAKFNQQRYRSAICAGEEYSKYTRLVNQMFETFLVYKPSTDDKITFCHLYEQWLNAYLKCCSMNLKRDYLSEVIQDTYHTYKCDIRD